MEQFLDEENTPSETEVAHLMNISPETVKKIQKQAIESIRNVHEFKELKEAYGDESVVPDSPSDDSYNILK